MFSDETRVLRQVLAIGRMSLLEARRTRLGWLTLALAMLAFGAGGFVREVAVTESARMQLGILAAALRLLGVFVTSLHIIGSMTRDFNEKGIELLLSLDLPRAGLVLGKALGYLAVALLVAVALALPLAPLAPPGAWLRWGASLAAELCLVASLSLFAILSFRQILPAASVVLGFYLLARSIAALQLIGGSSLAEPGPGHDAAVLVIRGLALLLPDLAEFTRTDWLTEAAGDGSALGRIVLQSGLYCLLLLAAATVDLYRRNF